VKIRGYHAILMPDEVVNAIEDDDKQVEVARYLNISDSAVSKVFFGI